MRHLLLLVDDEPAVLDSLYRILKRDTCDVLTATSAAEALRLLETESVSLCLVDRRLRDMDGLDFLRHLSSRHPEVACAMMSGQASVDLAVQAMRDLAVRRWDDPTIEVDAELVVREVTKEEWPALREAWLDWLWEKGFYPAERRGGTRK